MKGGFTVVELKETKEEKKYPKLNAQQQLFVETLLATIPYDTENAYIVAYGSKGDRNTNQKYASQVLRSEKVKEYKKNREQEILEEMGCNPQTIARKLMEIGFADKGDKVYTPAVQLKAIDLLQKQFGLQQSRSTIDANVKEQVMIVNDLPEDDEDANKTQ